MIDFADKVVLITGAAGGIGQVMCRHFGGLGARIGAIDKSDSLPDWLDSLRGEGFESAGKVADTADAWMDADEARKHQPHIVFVDDCNRISTKVAVG